MLHELDIQLATVIKKL